MPANKTSSPKRKEARAASRLRGKQRKAYRAELQREAHVRNKKEGTSPWAKAKEERRIRRRALQILKK